MKSGGADAIDRLTRSAGLACITGFQRFESAEAANQRALAMQGDKRRNRRPCIRRPYRCTECGAWHLRNAK